MDRPLHARRRRGLVLLMLLLVAVLLMAGLWSSWTTMEEEDEEAMRSHRATQTKRRIFVVSWHNNVDMDERRPTPKLFNMSQWGDVSEQWPEPSWLFLRVALSPMTMASQQSTYPFNIVLPTLPPPKGVPIHIQKLRPRDDHRPGYALSIATMVQDKSAFIVEWVVFHRLQGVEHFFIVDDRSDDYAGLERVLMPYIRAGIVELASLRDILPIGLYQRNPGLFWSIYGYANESYAQDVFDAFLKCERKLAIQIKDAREYKINNECQVAVLKHGHAAARYRGDQWSSFWDVDEFIFADVQTKTSLVDFLSRLPPTIAKFVAPPLPFGPIPDAVLAGTHLMGVRPNTSQPSVPDGRIDLVTELSLASVAVAFNTTSNMFFSVQPQWPSNMPKDLLDLCLIRPGSDYKSICRASIIDVASSSIHDCYYIKTNATLAMKTYNMQTFRSDAPIKFFHYKYLSVAMSAAKAKERLKVKRNSCYSLMDQPLVQQYLTAENHTDAAAYSHLVRSCAQQAALRDDAATSPECSHYSLSRW